MPQQSGNQKPIDMTDDKNVQDVLKWVRGPEKQGPLVSYEGTYLSGAGR